jgi:hypothetical protein
MGLAEEVLALHDAIREVMIIENQAGELRVIDQVGKDNHSILDAVSEHEKDTAIVAPTMILGAASRLGNVQKSGELRLVGLLYEQQGALCVPINADSYLLVTTANESFLEVMNALQRFLPSLTRQRFYTSEPLAINSAIDADQAVRTFFANTKLCEANSVHMEDAILNSNARRWQVSGSYRPTHAVRAKRYYIELDAKTGAVTKFQARP